MTAAVAVDSGKSHGGNPGIDSHQHAPPGPDFVHQTAPRVVSDHFHLFEHQFSPLPLIIERSSLSLVHLIRDGFQPHQLE